MIIDCIADLHGELPMLEGGDLLIVAGDLTTRDCIAGYDRFFDWLALQNYKHKVYIGGNHDGMIESGKYSTPNYCDAIYLCDSGTEFEYEEFETCLDSTLAFTRKKKLKIWGSPWTPQFPMMNPHCMAFTRPYMQTLKDRWDLIPDDTDILITHGPPNGMLDKVKRDYNASVGDMDLALAVSKRIRPKLHVYGHIHEGYGQFRMKHWPLQDKKGEIIHRDDTIFVNCSIMNEEYDPVNKPVRIIL